MAKNKTKSQFKVRNFYLIMYFNPVRDIEKKLEDREAFCVSVQKKQTEDSIEIVKLRHEITELTTSAIEPPPPPPPSTQPP